MSTRGGTRAVIAAMAANLGIAVTKFAAFVMTGSSSMLSEAIHSVADTGNQALLLIGGRRALRAPDAQHPFGYGRTRFLYSFIVAIIIFLLGGLFSLYEGWHKFHHPEIPDRAWVAYAVLGISILLEAYSFRTALREANHSRGSKSLVRDVHDARQLAAVINSAERQIGEAVPAARWIYIEPDIAREPADAAAQTRQGA
jgi:cation diffusion facilitator family transporter